MLWRSGDFTLTKFLRELAVGEGDRRPRPGLWGRPEGCWGSELRSSSTEFYLFKP